MAETIKKTSSVSIAMAWAIVLLPALWGLNYTMQNALKIFAKPGASVSSPGK